MASSPCMRHLFSGIIQNRMRAITVALALAGLTSGSAWDALDGNKLAEDCRAYPSGKVKDTVTALSVGTCFGYIWGVVGAGDRSSFCIPDGVKQLQVIDVVKQWIDQHPALRHYTAASLVTKALKESFPCKQ